MPVGKRIYLCCPPADSAVLAHLRCIPAANIADVMAHGQTMPPRICLVSRPVVPVMAWHAVIVRSCAGDNPLIHAASDLCGCGDVLVVSQDGDSVHALMGGDYAGVSFHPRR